MLDEDSKWFRVSLRIMGDGFDPVSVEELLGLLPATVGIEGQSRLGKNGRKYAPYESNLWVHQVDVSSDMRFEDQIGVLFKSLGDRVEKLRILAKADGITAELFCGFGSGNGQGGAVISPATLKLLGETGLSLCLDLYPPSVDEAEDSFPK